MSLIDMVKALLAEQRHLVLDPEQDSVFPVLIDPDLCHHGRPIRDSQFECPDCKTGHRSRHQPDFVYVTPGIQLCRECGHSWGTHGDTLR